MPDLVELMARTMYWDRVNPDRGAVMLDVAVQRWEDLADEHRSGLQVWHCKQFWRDAATSAQNAIIAAGFEIVPSTTSLIEKGKDVVTEGKVR